MRLALLVLSLTCNFATYAHGPEVGFFDGDGIFRGKLLNATYHYSHADEITLLTTEGHFLRYRGDSGGVMSSRPYYTSNQCLGQPYILKSPYNADNFALRGNDLTVLNSVPPKVAVIPWWPKKIVAYPAAYRSEEGVCVEYDPSTGPSEPIMIRVDLKGDLKDYGITEIEAENYRYGYFPKLTPRTTTSDILFCSGFESCD